MRLSRRDLGFGVAAAALAPVSLSAQPAPLDQQLTAYLDQAFEQELAMDQSVADMKKRFDPAKLDEEARTSFDMWIGELDRAEISHRWRSHRYCLQP
jgi:hypothetical protein